MILRKPYAFLIKHFKLIHVVLVVLSCYSIYMTKLLLDFFNDYVSSMINVIGQDLAMTLLPGFYRITPLLILGLTMIILVVMFVKKKPNLFYIINVVIYIFVLIIINVSSSTLQTMASSLIDVRTARLTRDLIVLSFMVQFISIPVIAIRAIGFDIKKFNFKEDLEELEINEEDREEFEVQVTFDKNKLIRKIRRIIRFLKYSYQENKLLCNLSAVGIISGVSVFIYINFIAQTPIITQNTSFNGNGFTLNILDSYLVNTDYKGNVIDDEYYYLLVKTNIKVNSSTSEVLDTATTKIVIGNYYYLPIMEYKDKFIDFGDIYQNEKINSSFQEKVLVYQIPKQLINNDMIFTYVNKNSFTDKEGFKSTRVKIDYTDLTGIKYNEKYNLGDTLQFKDTILNDYKIQITDYDISEKYKLAYNYCNSLKCVESYEYLSAALNTNYDKVLLKLTGTLESNNKVSGVYDLYDFIEYFGKICYNVDGVSKTKYFNLKQVVSSKIKEKNVYYIEVPKEIEDASDISFVITIRDRIYEYVLK